MGYRKRVVSNRLITKADPRSPQMSSLVFDKCDEGEQFNHLLRLERKYFTHLVATPTWEAV